MRKIIAVFASVVMAVGLGTASANADNGGSGISVERYHPGPGEFSKGKVRFTIHNPGGVWWQVDKYNPRTGRQWTVRDGNKTKELTVRFPHARKNMRVRVYTNNGRDRIANLRVSMPNRKPFAKPDVWTSINTWFRHAKVYVYGWQPKNTAPTRLGTQYRIQIVNPLTDHVRTVQRGRVSGGEGNEFNIRLHYRPNGPDYKIIRVKARGDVKGHKRIRLTPWL